MARLKVGQAYGKYIISSNNPDSGSIAWTYSNSGSNDIFSGLTTDPYSYQTIGDGSNYFIYYFGIQTLPGVIFNINSNKIAADSVIQVGQTGIFELNLFDTMPIEKITFENLQTKLAENTKNDGVNYCLIDIIYEEIGN